MSPYDIIWYALAFLVASFPVSIGLMMIGYTAVLVKREWCKAEIKK